jgi:hypothetical protein
MAKISIGALRADGYGKWTGCCADGDGLRDPLSFVATTRGNVGETRGTPSTGKLANAHAQWQFCASRACAMSVQAAGNFLTPVPGNICLTMAEMRI